MTLRSPILFITILALSLNSFGHEADSLVAKQFVNYLKVHDFAKAHTLFDESVKSKLSPSLLETTWAQVTSKMGELTQVENYHVEKGTDHRSFYFPCQFEKQFLDLKVVVTSSNGIGGFFSCLMGIINNQTPIDYLITINQKTILKQL